MGIITITINIMAIRIIILGIIMAITTFVSCREISQDLREAEKKAFALCDYDRMIGLTWEEVFKCEERFKKNITEMRIPTKEDFDNANLNGDKILLFEEWEKYMETLE